MSISKKGLNDNIKYTVTGGIAIKMINESGANSVKGKVVSPNSGAFNSVILTVQDVPDAIGVFLDDGVPDGLPCWIVISGKAYVYFVGNTTRGHIARTFVAADGDYVTGQAKSEAVPTSPFATDKHFSEIGHVLETRVGAGLALCNLHFN